MRLFLYAGMLAATASLGLVLLWDVDGGLTQIDKYLYSSDDFIKSGAARCFRLKFFVPAFLNLCVYRRSTRLRHSEQRCQEWMRPGSCFALRLHSTQQQHHESGIYTRVCQLCILSAASFRYKFIPFCVTDSGWLTPDQTEKTSSPCYCLS